VRSKGKLDAVISADQPDEEQHAALQPESLKVAIINLKVTQTLKT
jgi:hypothetical protein